MRISDWSSDVCSSDLSENRIIGMMKGQINATVVDLSNKNKLMEMGGDKFHVLPGVSEVPSDELIFASDDWIANHPEAVSVVVEELLQLWNEMEANPAIIEEERAKRNTLARWEE